MLIGAVAFAFSRTQDLSARAGIVLAISIAVCAALLATELLPSGGVVKLLFGLLKLDFPRFIDKNVNRGLCALVVLVWLAVMSLRAQGRHRAALALLFLLAVPVFGMDSQSAQLALLGGGLAYVAVLAVPQTMPRVLAIAIPLFIAAWPQLFPVLDRALFSNPTVYADLPDTAQHRVEIWRFVIDKIAERPWLGWGAETSRNIPGGDVVYSGERKYLPLHPHNSAFQVLLELGVVGFALSIVALALALQRWARLAQFPPHTQAAAAAMIVAYLSMGFTAFGVWQYWWLGVGWLGATLWRMARA